MRFTSNNLFYKGTSTGKTLPQSPNRQPAAGELSQTCSQLLFPETAAQKRRNGKDRAEQTTAF
jgi:hypothetical protein